MSHWKPTTVKFKCWGAEFEASVMLYPGFDGNREQPPEGPELEFKTITHEGQDVSWMLSYEHLLEKLDDAAWEQINKEWEPDTEDYTPEDLEP